MHISAVVVAYNRRELLLENLAALHGQTRSLDSIVVIDNASDDDSAAAVATRFPTVDVLSLSRNTGGAGGFAIGIERAISAHGAELVWIMDDDTVPSPDALAELLSAWERSTNKPVVLASRVVWTNGVDHPMNTPRAKPFASVRELRDARAIGAIPIRSASFVSVLVDARAVSSSGLPIAEYFIWNDDFEFTARLLRRATGVAVPSSVVVHKTKALADTDVDPGDRFYYEVRNKLWLFRFSSALAWYETPLYLASTARRWLSTALKSQDRPRLGRAFWMGWRHGIRRRPRPSSAYLASLGVESPAVARFEESVRRP